MNVIIDAIMSTDPTIIRLSDDALKRAGVPIDKSRFVDRVICTGTNNKKAMMAALKIMSVMPISDLVALLTPIYNDHSESISEIFGLEDADSEANFKRVIRLINGNGLVANSLNDETLMNLKKALKKEDE
ncbi:hypothetical protein [Photobacterium damselae]|uniref:hypothetical protein n=1 Tax=Photobacterium damselae TaxID=38293 RepID=UPI001F3E0658|nr:hypothetical protein [Photobacterium damselae]UKA04641.1 hypothetical protein IHC89_23770 [Photobacterium damselae subsp. damselae]